MQNLKFKEAVHQALDQILGENLKTFLMGLGVPDPKGVFGTTIGLEKKYGPNRVMDMPTSENAMMGVAIGAAIRGMIPIMSHQRVDFFLLALDQLINNASKWYYMFGGRFSVPIVIRLIIGQGWGQGPQHSQSLHSVFAHIPGIKVIMPSSPSDAKGLLISAVEDPNPVIFMEHRWLYETHGYVPSNYYKIPIGKANIIKSGKDITLISFSHMLLECRKSLAILEKENIDVELIDLRTVLPYDKETILTSVRKTSRVVIVDPDWKTNSFASEIIAFISEEIGTSLKSLPKRICYPDRFSPSSPALSKFYYPTHFDIASTILHTFGKDPIVEQSDSIFYDVPDKNFVGPF